jgi:CMP-N-acetylneuraminic acid synthetase
MINVTKNNCVAFIFARGGSKGVPRKNIRDLGGIPLIAYSIQIALECSSINCVVVSTEDEEIASISRKYGAEVPFMRPVELAGDDSNEYDAWKHAISSFEEISHEKIDVFVSLPPTSPLRSVSDVENCIHEYTKTEADTVITVKEATRSPYFNMVRDDDEGFSHIVNLAPDGARYIRRQDVPVVYDMTTVAYVSSPAFILNSDSIFSGKVRSVLVDDERAIDIDTMLDFKFAEFLITEKGNL